MALIANSFTVEIIIIIVGIYFLDGGFIRRLSALSMFVINGPLIYSSQVYVSDLTTQPANVFLFFTPSVATTFFELDTILALLAIAFIFLNLRKMLLRYREWKTTPLGDAEKEKQWDIFLEEFV